MRFKPSIFLSLLVILILFLDLLEAYRGHQKYPRGPKREGAFRRRRKLGFSRSVQVFYNNDNHQRRQPGQLRKQQIDVRCRHLARQRFDSCGPSIYRGVVPGGAGGAMAPPDFGRSVNPISTRGKRLCPPNYYWQPRIFRPSDGPEYSSMIK